VLLRRPRRKKERIVGLIVFGRNVVGAVVVGIVVDMLC
jgi:hypothetical protein